MENRWREPPRNARFWSIRSLAQWLQPGVQPGPDFVSQDAAIALTYQKITRLESAPTVLANSNLRLFDRGRIGDLTLAYPKNRTTAGLDWSLDKFGVNLRETYYSRTVSVDTLVPARDSINADAWITDLTLRYDFSDNVAFNLGANNLFNKRPSQLNPVAQLNYG